MSLNKKLDETRAESAKRRPAETRAIMQRATDDLRASGILGKTATVGQAMPPFAGTSHDGRTVVSDKLLAQGPVILSFFRGHW